MLPKGVLFYDNFEEVLRAWQFTETPAFFEKSQQLVIPTLGFTNGVVGDREWTDYALEVRVRIDESGQYGGLRLFVRNQVLPFLHGIPQV